MINEFTSIQALNKGLDSDTIYTLAGKLLSIIYERITDCERYKRIVTRMCQGPIFGRDLATLANENDCIVLENPENKHIGFFFVEYHGSNPLACVIAEQIGRALGYSNAHQIAEELRNDCDFHLILRLKKVVN